MEKLLLTTVHPPFLTNMRITMIPKGGCFSMLLAELYRLCGEGRGMTKVCDSPSMHMKK